MLQLVQNAKARLQKKEEGFTLVELLVVIVILGILAAVVVFAVGGITDKGQSSACATDKAVLETAEEAHFANAATGSYATEVQLVSKGFLRAESSKWNVDVVAAAAATDTTPAVPASYTVSAEPNGGCA